MSEVENSLRVLIIDQICIINFSSYFGVFNNIEDSSLFFLHGFIHVALLKAEEPCLTP